MENRGDAHGERHKRVAVGVERLDRLLPLELLHPLRSIPLRRHPHVVHEVVVPRSPHELAPVWQPDGRLGVCPRRDAVRLREGEVRTGGERVGGFAVEEGRGARGGRGRERDAVDQELLVVACCCDMATFG